MAWAAWAGVLVLLLVTGAAAQATAASGLPDGRGYELVSPVNKNGGDVIVSAARTRAAADESAQLPMAVSFASLTGFKDVRGTGITTEYLGERDLLPGTSGWSAHAITPPQLPLSLFAASQFLDPLFEGEFSSDLTKGVFRAWSPLTDAPNVSGVENLYSRSDLRSPGGGTYQLLSDASSLLPTTFLKPALAGASADFSHVVFESVYSLTPDAGGCIPDITGGGCPPKLYEAVNGVVRLVGILPDGTPASAGCPGGTPCSIAGHGAALPPHRFTPHVISTDGERVLFTSPVGGNGTVTQSFTTGASASKLYMRDDHGTADTSDDTTVQIDASERTDCAGDPTCGGDGIPDPAPQTTRPGIYWDASADLSRIFFTSREALTDDAPNTANVEHLYMWSAAGSVGHRLTMLDVDANPSDPPGPTRSVFGASDDGHYVYFLAGGQLTAGGPTLFGQAGIYVWHDDGGSPEIDFIGQMTAPGIDEVLNAPGLNNWVVSPPLEGRVTHDGKHLLLESSTGDGLTGYDQITNCQFVCQELYVYSVANHQLVCASCNPSGAPATATTTDNARDGASGAVWTWHLSHAISDDGRYVFFTTAEALVPQDTNGKKDAYEYDAHTGTVHLISSGKDSSDSYFMDASGQGHDVFFVTRQQLVGWDTDDNYDLYDARIGGGVADPIAPAAECRDDACQGTPSNPSALGPAATATFSGVGNVHSAPAKPKRCKRGFVRKRVRGKVRCVKRKPARKARRATTQRRAK